MVSQCDNAGFAIFALIYVGDHRVRPMEWSSVVLPQQEDIARLHVTICPQPALTLLQSLDVVG